MMVSENKYHVCPSEELLCLIHSPFSPEIPPSHLKNRSDRCCIKCHPSQGEIPIRKARIMASSGCLKSSKKPEDPNVNSIFTKLRTKEMSKAIRGKPTSSPILFQKVEG